MLGPVTYTHEGLALAFYELVITARHPPNRVTWYDVVPRAENRATETRALWEICHGPLLMYSRYNTEAVWAADRDEPPENPSNREITRGEDIFSELFQSSFRGETPLPCDIHQF